MLTRLFHVGLGGLARFILAFILVGIEAAVRVTVFLTPGWVIRMGRSVRRVLVRQLPLGGSNRARLEGLEPDVVTATYSMSTPELIRYYGYQVQVHTHTTSDGWVLVLHRVLPPASYANASGGSSGGSTSTFLTSRPPVLLGHGLMQCSETWVTTHDATAFLLVDAGFDVWLANNRGNRYSNKHLVHTPADTAYWDFSLDEHALIDLPANIAKVLDVAGTDSLGYVGFSQGSAMGFAGFSLDQDLAAKVNVFVALAPAARAVGLQSGLLKTFVDCAPESLFLLFGHGAAVPSALWWRNTLSPSWYVTIIDACVRYLFGWQTLSMSTLRKKLCYGHLYSLTSVKTVVGWFQIVVTNSFKMYDDAFSPSSTYQGALPVEYPISQLNVPLALFYGGEDKLPDFKWLLSVIPSSTRVSLIPHYEHIDLMWADDAPELVTKPTARILAEYATVPPIPTPRPDIPDSRKVSVGLYKEQQEGGGPSFAATAAVMTAAS